MTIVEVTAMLTAGLAHAQSTATPGGSTATGSQPANMEEIIVTARKKAESDIKVPVAMSVLGQSDLERQGIQSLVDVSAVTPGLRISATVAHFGGVASLRGIGATSTGFLADQAVAFTLDGTTLSNGQAVQFGLFDIERVEVLKGPQSLYYGKNTTAGIISVVSADPTDKLYAKARVGYEFEGRQILTEGVISGPLTENLGARLAIYHSQQDGLFDVPDTQGIVGYLGPIGPRTFAKADNNDINAGRLTLLAKPTDNLTANLKLTGYRKSAGSSSNLLQVFGCPLGVPNPSNPGILPAAQFQNCKTDNITSPEAIDPVTQSEYSNKLGLVRQFGARHLYLGTQYLASAKVDYDMTKALQLSSVSSYYNLDQGDLGSGTATSQNLFPIAAKVKRWDFTQELRLSSAFDSPINFMAGGFYQRGALDVQVDVLLPNFFFPGPPPPGHALVPASYLYQNSETRAAFGQITYNFTPDLQLLVGGRYTEELKSLLATDSLTGLALPNQVPNIKFTNFAPEATLAWAAEPNTNVFMSYRKGAKSGGYSVANNASSVAASDVYRNETAAGFEGGVKTLLLDRALRLDAIAYTYKYSDLQLGFFDTARLLVSTSNVGSAKSYGAELTATYRPHEIEGVTLAGSINYNHLRYGNGAAGSCYAGQSIAQGCRLNLVGGVFTAQDFNGLRPARSADWTGSARASYETPVSNSVDIGGTISANYTSRYNANAELDPLTEQAAYATVDAELRLFHQDEKWEFAVVGKNLTNMMRAQNGYPYPLTPAANLAGTPAGGQGADHFGFVNDPRTVQVRFTYRY